MRRRRKALILVDFQHIENGRNLSKIELAVREKIITKRDWEKLFFWMDMKEALKTLTEKQRSCFSLRHIEGYSETEIAKMLRLDQSTVSQHIAYAIEKLKIFLVGYP